MKKVTLLILLFISFALSRFLFTLVDDPEGPNLLIVTVLAVIIFAPSYLAFRIISKKHHTKK